MKNAKTGMVGFMLTKAEQNESRARAWLMLADALDESELIRAFPNTDISKRISPHYHSIICGVAVKLFEKMAVCGADNDELIRAGKFLYVAVDSLKHNLDWKAAQESLGINDLKLKYMKKSD